MQTLNQDIKDKTFRRVYLLFGDEPFLVNSYKKRLREAIAGDDTMNYNYFEGKGQDVKEIISLADTMPFFAERRLVLIDGSGFDADTFDPALWTTGVSFQQYDDYPAISTALSAGEVYPGDPGVYMYGVCGE